MSMSLRRSRMGLRFVASACALLGVCVATPGAALWGNSLWAQAPAARMETFAAADGSEYFALAVLPGADQRPAAPAAHDIVVLFDTSASQVNHFRDKGLDALEFLLGSLGENDRVRLMAVDIDAVPLTPTFVAPASAEMQAAVAALRTRTPLGTTDMYKAVTATISSFDGKELTSDRARSAVYIGDGMSLGGLVAGAEMQQGIDQLVAKQISVNSFAVGPRVDAQLLGVLANHTGGMLLVDSENLNGKQFGGYLAESAMGAVVWPTKVSLPDSVTEFYPKQFPPLRFNRDTVVVGLGKPIAEVSITIEASVQGKPVSLSLDDGSRRHGRRPLVSPRTHRPGPQRRRPLDADGRLQRFEGNASPRQRGSLLAAAVGQASRRGRQLRSSRKADRRSVAPRPVQRRSQGHPHGRAHGS